MNRGYETEKGGGMVILAGNSHKELAEKVADLLGCRLGECSVYNKPNRETMVDIKQSLRGKHVFLIQTGTKDVNNSVMELLILIYACKTSSAASITVVMPYLPYSKQCKMRKRSAIAAKLVAEMICKAGANKLMTMDLYRKEIQGFFSIPVDNLRASPFLLSYITDKIPDYKNAVIVAKNAGVMNKAASYAERLRIGIAVIHGESKDESEALDGRASPPALAQAEGPGLGGKAGVAGVAAAAAAAQAQQCQQYQPSLAPGMELFPSLAAKEKPPLTIVGDVSGRIAIMVDDMIDDVESFVAAAEVLSERGAYKIYVVATHGLLSADAPQLLENSKIDEVVVTNSVPHEVQKLQCHKIKTVDISLLVSEAVRRVYHGESMSYLFRDISGDD